MPSNGLAPRQLVALRKRLMTWFRTVQRSLPWRDQPTPYHVWLSEIMLQQTQVATVVPYFKRFIATFPTLADFAAADESAVLKLWEGLGYYRRARNAHRAARLMTERHGGKVPQDAVALAELPGIGRYTLGAILSIGFGMRWPIVDANVERVLARVFGYRDDVKSATGQHWLWATAEQVLPRAGVGAFNQALMELGALTCTPRDPQCLLCPLARHCVARRDGVQGAIPAKASKKRAEVVQEVAIVLQDGERVLLVQRPADAKRWASMWEFPHAERNAGEESRVAARRVLRQLTSLGARLSGEMGEIRHGITRFDVRMAAWHGRLSRGPFRSTFYVNHAWITAGQVVHYPLSTPQRRLVQLWLERAQSSAR